MFSNIYKGRKALVTGHNGFKGSWMCLWLQTLGAHITGLSLPPASVPSHWTQLNLDLDQDLTGDIRDYKNLFAVIEKCQPEIVFHMAAQPLVRRSYKDPLETWSTNVIGTANVLEACRHIPSVKVVVVVTTDKCYENLETDIAYVETDKLGGYDPYSASKAGAELVTSSYRKSFFSTEGTMLVASARAGNVIGGGDWSEDRLIPDLARSITAGTELEIRSPNATRPWQHVLDAIHGYLMLGDKLLSGNRDFAEAWNFGPDKSGNRTVHNVLTGLKKTWPDVKWTEKPSSALHEATLLQLDSTKARKHLKWKPVWELDECLCETARWYKAHIEAGGTISREQLDIFCSKLRT